MPVLRYLAPSVRAMTTNLGIVLDTLNRTDLAHLLVDTDDDAIQWSGGSLYLVPYTVKEQVAGVDVLLVGAEADQLAAQLVEHHKEHGEENEVLEERAWKLPNNVEYWEPRAPVNSYPGFEPEPYINVYWYIGMENFNEVSFEIDTNMSYSQAHIDFDDGRTLNTADRTFTIDYDMAGSYDVRIELDNGQVVVKHIEIGGDPLTPEPYFGDAAYFVVTATKPQ